MARETILLAYDLLMKSYTTHQDMESTIYPSQPQAFESIYLQNQNTNSVQFEEPSGLGLADHEVQSWNSRMVSSSRYATCNVAEMTPEMIQCHSLKKQVQVLTDEADLTRSKMKEVSEEVLFLKSCLENIDKKIEDNCQKRISRSRSPVVRSVVPLTEGTRQLQPSPAAMRRRSSVLCHNRLTPKVLNAKEKSSAIVLKSPQKLEYPRTGLSTQQLNRSKIAVKSSIDRIRRSSRAIFVPEVTKINESSTTSLTSRADSTSNVFLLAPKVLKREISAVKVGKHTHPRPKHTIDLLKGDVQTAKTLTDERRICPMSSLEFEELFAQLDAMNQANVTPSQVRRRIVRMKGKNLKSGAKAKTPLVRHPISRSPSTVSSISRHTEKSTHAEQAVIKQDYACHVATRVHFEKTSDSALQTCTEDTIDCEDTEINHLPSVLESTKHGDSETHVFYDNTNTNKHYAEIHQKCSGIDYRKRLCFKKREPVCDVPNENAQSCLMTSEINELSANNCIATTTSVSEVPDSCLVEECPGSKVFPTECEERPLWKYTCRSRNETRSILEQINRNTIQWDEFSISKNMEPNIDGSAAHSIVTEKSSKSEIDDSDCTFSDLDTITSSCTIVAMSTEEETQREIDCESWHEIEISCTTSSRVEDIQVSEMIPLAENVTTLETFSEVLPLVEGLAETSPLVEDTYASGALTMVMDIKAFETSPLVEDLNASGTLKLVVNTNAFETSPLVEDIKVSKSVPLIVEEIINYEPSQCVAVTKYLEPLSCFKDHYVAKILHRVKDRKASETLSCIVETGLSGSSFEQDTVPSRTTMDDKQDEHPENIGIPLTAEKYHEELDRRVSKALENNIKRVPPAVQLFSLSYRNATPKKPTPSSSKIAEERKALTDNKTDGSQGEIKEGKVIYVKRPCKFVQVRKKRSGDGNDNVIQRSPTLGKSVSPIEDRFQSTVDWDRSTVVSKTRCNDRASEAKKGINNIPSMFRASHSSILQRSSSVFRESGNRHVDAVTPKKNTIIIKNRTPRVVKMPRVPAEDA